MQLSICKSRNTGKKLCVSEEHFGTAGGTLRSVSGSFQVCPSLGLPKPKTIYDGTAGSEGMNAFLFSVCPVLTPRQSQELYICNMLWEITLRRARTAYHQEYPIFEHVVATEIPCEGTCRELVTVVH